MIESFTQAQFENVLAQSDLDYSSLGFVQGELTYILTVDSKVKIEIRSTIDATGTSRETGKDSIRLWLIDVDKRPLGKVDKWLQRTKGWDVRLLQKVKELIEIRKLAGDCPICCDAAAVFVSHSEKNDGKLYAKCVRHAKFLHFLKIKSDDVAQNKKEIKSEIKRDKKSVLEALESNEDITPVIKQNFTPSKYQIPIKDFIENGTGNGEVKAYAGTGKTSTMVYGVSDLPEKLKVKNMVFAKANQLDAKGKMPSHISVQTANAAGFADIRRRYPRIELDTKGYKSWDILKELYPNEQGVFTAGHEIVKLVSLCKQTFKEPTIENLEYLGDRYQVYPAEHKEFVYEATDRVYKRSLEISEHLIDYDDQVLIPALGLVPVEKCDILIIDEFQDSNQTQQEYYLRVGKDGRKIWVGDDFQSIMGFRGTVIGAMAQFAKILNPTSFELPICYRCPTEVLKLAQTIVPKIQPRENAPKGLVQNVSGLYFNTNVKLGDVVLCRNNAPLVRPCFELIRNGIKATIRGRDIGQNLSKFIEKIQRKHGISNSEMGLFFRLMGDYVRQEAHKLRVARKENQAVILEDQFETILALSDGVASIYTIHQRIKDIFSDLVEGIVFSTIHKAKGLEFDNVWVLNPELLSPQKYDTQDWHLEQLRHLNYVCWTRSKETLNFVNV